MSNLEDNRHSVTIKYGTAYDAPWHVIHGNTITELKETLVEAYCLPDKEQPLPVLVAQAKKVATTGQLLVSELGASQVTENKPQERHKAPETPARAQQAATEATSEPEASPKEEFLKVINNCDTKAETQALFAQNQAAITGDEELKAAIIAKMKSFG